MLIAAGALLFGAFIAGAHVGFYQWWLLDSSVRATMLAGELRALRAGNSDKLIPMKEIELDTAIVDAFRFQESGQSWIFWPMAKSFEHARYLRSVAEYRKQHPSPGMPKEVVADAEQQKEAEAYDAEVAQRNVELLRRYAK